MNKRQAQAKLAELREKRQQKRRRRTLAILLLLLLFLLLCCLPDCNCEGPPPEPAPPVPEEPAPEPVVEAPPPPLGGRIKRRKRPKLPLPPPKPVPWLASFRLQVAARAPRLAECFEGVERPGSLKWTTSVEPVEGTVSDHVIEPTLLTADLRKSERACVLAVLKNPTYNLLPGDEPSTPSRVGLVIEF